MMECTMKSTRQQQQNILYYITSEYSVWIGLFIRLFIAWFLPWLMDQNPKLGGVDYTDIDFHVFSDAAQYIQHGGSPYQRATYRYTPFVAYLLSKFPHREYGRVLFCIADTVCGYIILLHRRRNRLPTYTATTTATNTVISNTNRSNNNNNSNNDDTNIQPYYTSRHLEDSMRWLYNPLAINICTRGSAESLVVLLPVLVTVWITTSKQQQQRQQQSSSVLSTTTQNDINSNTNNKKKYHLYTAAILAGLFHGIAIHAKLYPVIYTLSFMTQFVGTIDTPYMSDRMNKRSIIYKSYRIVLVWIRRLLHPAPILFGISTVVTFCSITYLAVQWYGIEALNEGLLYHFSRVDHRHNYSMHWYWIYLLRDRIVSATMNMNDHSTVGSSAGNGIHPEFLTKIIGIMLLLPQVILLLYCSIGIAPYSLSLALFVQTFLFVAHNKVITAQYFTWYLCLLPLCSDQFRLTRRVRYALLILGLSIIFWLSSAYCLEMQGMAVHRIVWMASLLFFVANTNLLGALLSTTAEVQRQTVVKLKAA